MQFTVWRYSGKSRLIVEFFSTLIITILTHAFLHSAQQNHRLVVGAVLEIEELQNGYLHFYNEYEGDDREAVLDPMH